MSPETVVQKDVDESLKKIAEGSSITFVGLVLSLLPLLIIRLIIVRQWTESDYGIFSLAFSILSICWTVGTLGLQNGLSRNIAYLRETKDYQKISMYISTSIWFSLITSVVIGIVLFLLSENISNFFFHTSNLIVPLKIISFIIPFYSLINVIVSIYLGFDQVKPTVYFQQILLNVLFLFFIVIIIFFDNSFVNIFYALAIAAVVTFVLLISYSGRQVKSLEVISVKSIKSPSSTELLFVSFPLLVTSVFLIIFSWADTILLGSLRNTIDVGLYNTALPIAQIISFPLSALFFIHLPIFTGLFAQNKSEEIKRSYSILTKWICYVTLPFFFLLFLYPEPIIAFLFGQDYISAALALRILSIGYIAYDLVGPSGMTLVVIGKYRFEMFSWIFAVILNVCLDVALIPTYGIAGAAFSLSTSIIAMNVIKTWKLHTLTGVQPLSKNLLKPTILFTVIIILLYLISGVIMIIDWWMLPLLFVFFYGVFLFAIFITKSVDREDISLITSTIHKVKSKINGMKRIVSKDK